MKQLIFGLSLIVSVIFSPQPSVAAVPELYTNANYIDSTQEEPVSFFNDGWGGFYGYTTSGRLFTQTPVANDVNLRLHKFAIDEAYFYISDKGPIFADSDLAAVSIYFSIG